MNKVDARFTPTIDDKIIDESYNKIKLTIDKCERIAMILKEMKKTLENESKNNKDYMFI